MRNILIAILLGAVSLPACLAANPQGIVENRQALPKPGAVLGAPEGPPPAPLYAMPTFPAGKTVAPPAGTALPPGAPPLKVADLATLWGLALDNNPNLREAGAAVEEARGQLIQAGKYPNPQINYFQDYLGSSISGAGNVSVTVSQTILTANKRPLDMAIADKGVAVASAASRNRLFEVLTRVRRAYYDFLVWEEATRVTAAVVGSLEESREITRKLVEQAKTRPRTDLIRIQASLEQARINQARVQITREAAWRQLAAEVGLPQLPPPAQAGTFPPGVPPWDGDAVHQRVQTTNAELQQAAVEVERARLQVDRARAGAVPDVRVTGGYQRGFVDMTAGGIVGVETTLPLWDRKQGSIYEAQARIGRAQAALQGTSTRLSRETAEALGRFYGAGQQVQRLTQNVIPPLEEALSLVRKGYLGGAPDITFADVVLSLESLNTARLGLVEARRELWRAVADLQGLMQLNLNEELGVPGFPCP